MASALQIVRKFYPDVTEVRDAGRNMNIEVLSGDIKGGTLRNHNDCALAKACKRRRDVDGVVIALNVAYLVHGDRATRYSLPESLSREIVAFDRKGNFAPGEYRLLIPKRKLGAPAATGSSNRSGEGRKVRYRHVTESVRSF